MCLSKKYVIILIALLIALTGCTKYVVKDDLTPIPTYQGNNQRTGFYNTELVNKKLKVKWIHNVKQPKLLTASSTRTQPIIYEGLVFFGDNNTLKALDVETGKEKWHFLSASNVENPMGIQSTPCISNNVLYFAGASDYFYALDVKTGKKKWQFASPYGGSSPIVNDDTVYFCSDYLYALDKNNGKLKWKTKLDYQHFNYSAATPAYAYGLIFCSEGEQKINAYDSKKGRLVWTYNTYADWTWNLVTSPVVYKGSVFFGSQDGYFYSLNALNGKLNWKTFIVNFYEGNIAPPSVDKEAVYYFACGTINALNYKTGKIKWKYGTRDDLVFIPPVVTKNCVIVGFHDYPYIIMINKKTGEKIKAIKSDIGITSPIAVSKDKLYYGSLKGPLYALE